MARRSWNRCECGKKLHRKKGHTICIPCKKQGKITDKPKAWKHWNAQMKLKTVLPIIGLVALTALGTVGYIKRDDLMYKAYKKSSDLNRKLYDYQIKKENITSYH